MDGAKRSVWRERVSIGFVAIAMAGSLLPAISSCESLPDKTCRGETVNGLTQDGGGLDPRCTTCLQQKCCDAVGYCFEEEGCADSFRQAHECVAASGPAGESVCINQLGGPTRRSRQLYDCMRANCGGSEIAEAPCGVSSCVVDPSVVLLATPSCDRCLGGSCCKEINECYGDRRCKLAVECIVRDCGATLGLEMSSFAAAGEEAMARVREFVCADSAGRADQTPPPNLAGTCVQRCLGEFAPTPGTADDDRARCLALDVYACGARSGCGAACVVSPADAGGDGGGEAGASD